jgi:Response regulator containing a CheY-like receiver domain and an HTH DNA-binding domain
MSYILYLFISKRRLPNGTGVEKQNSTMKLSDLSHRINYLGAAKTEQALRLYQKYICTEFDAVYVTWCALYRGPFGKDVWHTVVMDDWKVFDIVFPENVVVDKDEARSKFYAKAKKEGDLGPGIMESMRSTGRTRAHLIEDSISLEKWKQHWVYKLLQKQGVADRMSGAYNLSPISESHVWVDRAIGKSFFNDDERNRLVDIMNMFPRLHRWLMLERGLLEPAARPLSPREKDVMKLLLGPWSEAEISEKLSLSKGTVHNYIIGIYKNFNVSGRYQLMHVWLD